MPTHIAPTVHAHTTSLAVPITQNTAPVLEFKCLFTNDIRRKQKRWQDGRLKFHAFNKRVRVFDDRGGSVGDTHFQQEYEFGEDEELELDRGGVLVQVGECVARGEQDLSELLDKRLQEKEKRREARAAAAAVASSWATPSRTVGALSLSGVTPTVGTLQARPKSLHQLLGTPSGHHGKAALPTRSPFEERQWNAQDSDKENIEERPAKRRKPEPAPSRAGYAQNLTGATLNLSTPTSTPALRSEAIKSRPIIRHRYAESIDLTGDEIQPVDGTARLTPNATTDSSGIRLAKAQHIGSGNEKRKPDKAGYAENLTGAALTLSGTYGKSRVTGTTKLSSNDGTLAKSSHTLQRSAGSGTVHPPLSKNANPFSREGLRFKESGAVDEVITNPRGASDSIMDDEGFVEIGSSPVGGGVIDINRSVNPPRLTSHKRQKISQRKSKSTSTTSRPSISSDTASKDSSDIPVLQRPNGDTEKLMTEENATVTAKRLRPLRIKAHPPRCMLISATRSGSRSSLETSKSRAAEITKSGPNSDHQKPSGVISSKVTNRPDVVLPEQDSNQTSRQQSTSDVFDDQFPPETLQFGNFSTTVEFLEPSRQSPRTNGIEDSRPAVREEPARQPTSGTATRRTDAVSPSSSPEFEGLDYQAIDTLLSRNGNASPFAPQALRKAVVGQEKSPLQRSRIRERSPKAPEIGRTATSKPAGPSRINHNISTTNASRAQDPQETVLTEQIEAPRIGNAGAKPDEVNHEKRQKPLPKDSIDIPPIIRESYSAPDTSIPSPAIPQVGISSKPKDDKLLPSPQLINHKTIPSPSNQEIEKSNALPTINSKKLNQQTQPNITEDPAQPQPVNLPLPPPPPQLQPQPSKKTILPNPATRGKKAAQKTDAAGKVPIMGPIFPHPMPPVPPPPAPIPRRGTNRVSQGRVLSTGSLGGGGGVGGNGGVEGNRIGGAIGMGGGGEGDMGGGGDGKGAWGKEAFDLFDWRPPRLRMGVGVGVDGGGGGGMDGS